MTGDRMTASNARVSSLIGGHAVRARSERAVEVFLAQEHNVLQEGFAARPSGRQQRLATVRQGGA
jgi:hypothetical protein